MKRLLLALAAIGLAAVLIGPLTRQWLGGRTPAGPAATHARNLLIVTLDTTRADRIGTYGYAAARTPVLDALAREGARFDNAAAVAPITGPSHAGMFTGVYPARFAVRDNVTTPLPDEALTLAEVLSANGLLRAGLHDVRERLHACRFRQRSQRPAPRRRGRRRCARAIRADGWKAIDAPRPELYNLRDDPGELRNLYDEQRARADRMIGEAVRLDREMAGGAEVKTAPVDAETLERLRSLGYVGPVSPSRSTDSGAWALDKRARGAR